MSSAPANANEYDVIAKVVQHYTDVSRMARESAHEVGEEALSSFYIALRATSLMILPMLSLLFVSALFAAPPAIAQQLCGERTVILKDLASRYSEKPQAMGLSSDGKLVEVLVSSSGSWTILISFPNKLSCLAATGENWELNRDVVFGPPA